MSVFFGLINKNNKAKINDKSLKDITDNLSLSGRRSLKKIVHDNLIFCHARLPDEEKEMIVENEDGSLLLMLGGRLFGYKKEIKELIRRGHRFKYQNNPAEFALHSFEEFGTSVFKRLNGIFSLAIWDNNKKELIMADDIFGLYPVFIYKTEEIFIFCSEYQPILKYSGFKDDLNYNAIAEYHIIGATLREKTFFKHINKLPAASVLQLKNNKEVLNKYDVVDIEIQRKRPIEFFAEKIEERMKEALKIGIEYCGLNNCDLSGGVDTRFIVGLLSSADRQRMIFRTYMDAYLNEDTDKNVVCASMVSESLGLKHKVIKCGKKRDFTVDFFDKIRLKETDNNTLCGREGTEFLGGVYLRLYPRFIYPREEIEYIDKNLSEYFSKSFIKKIDDLSDLRFYSKLSKKGTSFKNKNRAFLFSIDLLCKSFLTTMYYGSFGGSAFICPWQCCVGLEFSPFLDKDIIKILLAVPPEYLKDYKLYMTIMEMYHRDLMKLPYFSGDCRDARINQLEPGQHSFVPKGYNHEKFLKLCFDKPLAWGKEYFNNKQYRREKFTELNSRYLKTGNISYAEKIELAKFLDFEAWMRYALGI